ncbi:MAG: type II secretion system protein [Gammaproteobacteria bacterium]
MSAFAMKQRGYTLVEIMLALVVLGILLGGALVPLQARYEAGNRAEAEEYMHNARESVVGYAVANQTKGLAQVLGGIGILYDLPAGRPYLPCPDIDGDGLENRRPLEKPGNANYVLADGDLRNYGACEEQKGLLPWRTLGLPENTDPWGRRLGYWVDVAFSNQALGFDESFRADIFDPRIAAVLATPDDPVVYQLRQDRHTAGALVCSSLYKIAAAPRKPGCPATDDQTFLIAGIVSTVSVNLGGIRNVPGYDSIDSSDPPQGILDGAAFVIFSHGPNGYGGINLENRCLPPPPDSRNLAERANAYYAAGHPMIDPAGDFRCASLTLHTELAENLFVSAPHSGIHEGDTTGADDIVHWTSPNVLVGMLVRSGALPVPKLDFLPEEQ